MWSARTAERTCGECVEWCTAMRMRERIVDVGVVDVGVVDVCVDVCVDVGCGCRCARLVVTMNGVGDGWMGLL